MTFPKIETYNIRTAMGKLSSFGDQLPFLSKLELEEFNNIGYTGKDNTGKRTSRQEFLNKLNKGTFQVNQTKRDNGDFQEAFQIIRVISKQAELEVEDLVSNTVTVTLQVITKKGEEDIKNAVTKGLFYGLDIKKVSTPTQMEITDIKVVADG